MRYAPLGLLLASSVALAQPLPVLQFTPPQGFTGSLGKDPSAHVSMNGDATLNIYPFRRLNGPFEEQFRRTRLRELLVQDSQEAQLGGPVEIQKLAVPGAEAALFARFAENRFGTTRYRLRLGVYSAGAVALVDYNANGPDAYQRNWPAVAAVLDSLKVGAPQPTTAAKPSSTGGASGLYLASTLRFVMRIGGPLGSGDQSDRNQATVMRSIMDAAFDIHPEMQGLIAAKRKVSRGLGAHGLRDAFGHKNPNSVTEKSL